MTKEPTELEQSQIEVNKSQSEKTRAETVALIRKELRTDIIFWTGYTFFPLIVTGQINNSIVTEILKWIK